MGPRHPSLRTGSMTWLASVALALLVAAPPAAANSTQILISHGLITRDVGDGGDLFFRGTFGGNGRTCGTCHPVDNNQTVDPDFIATLPPDDPLFVAENNPALAELEKPKLMRDFGLILENVDGFENPTVKFVLRGTPHSLSLATSVRAPAGFPQPEATGWSGDGSPAGTLLDFPTGAVKQHFTQTLARNPGDFVPPTAEELRVMEVFMLSVGRTEDLDLQVVSLADADAELGRRIFLNTGSDTTIGAGKCNNCHANAGANVAFGDPPPNRNFDTGVEEVPHPGRTSVTEFPFDGGLGTELNEEGTFGDGTFNTPPLVEAADTGPFFHNHVIASLEDSVAFYSTKFFNESPAAVELVGPINLTATESDQVAAFLRVLNAGFNLAISEQRNGAAILLENNSFGGCGDETFLVGEECASFEEPGKRATVNALLSLANAEALDAVEVLQGQTLHGSAVTLIGDGIALNEQAINTNSSSARKQLMQDALAKFQQAKAEFGTGLEFTLGQGNLMF